MKSLITLLLLAASVAQAKDTPPPGSKPNIVFIMTDDMGYETLSCNGATNYRTPNIDRLAKEGVVFTQADAMPLCCPTRTQVMTGQDHYRNYLRWNGGFAKTAPTMAQMMKSAGYTTGAFGKWHLGDKGSEFKMGFDDACIHDLSVGLQKGQSFQAHNVAHSYWQTAYRHNGKYEFAEYGPDLVNKYALEFIEKHKQGPFFLYYTPLLSHNPFCPTPDSRDRKCTDWQSNFEDMVAYTDKMVGNVIRKLKDLGIYENTIIVYTSDNGTKTCAGKMKDGRVIYGMKGTLTLDGCRMPLIVKSDGKHRQLDNLITFSDFYPTFCELAGIPSDKIADTIDGVSFAPLLNGETKSLRPFIFSYYGMNNSAYVRTQRFKYYIDQRLYDLEADPREHHPIYPATDTAVTAQARKELKQNMDAFVDDPHHASAVHRKAMLALQKKYAGTPREYELGTQQFNSISEKPKSVSWTYDVTPFLAKEKGNYTVSVSRSPRTSDSGMDYANAQIRKVTVTCDGKTLQAITPQNASMTTKYKAKVDNPLIDFVKTELNTKFQLHELALPPDGKKVELTVEADLSNPGNQWGDRILLYTYFRHNTGSNARE